VPEDLWKYKYYNFIVLLSNDLSKNTPMFYVLSLGKTSTSSGKYLVNMLMRECIMKSLPIFSKMFNLKTVEMQNDAKQKYLVASITKSKQEWLPEKFIASAIEARKFIDIKNNLLIDVREKQDEEVNF